MESRLKSDVMSHWIETEWIPNHPQHEWITIWTDTSCINDRILEKYDPDFQLWNGYRFAGYRPYHCPILPRSFNFWVGKSGAYVYHFSQPEESSVIEILVTAAFFADHGQLLTMVCVPTTLISMWYSFSNECSRISQSLSPEQKVYIIGGRSSSFVPTVNWEDIILPEKLKGDLLNDVQAFFKRGTTVYKRLKLKPFRKLLLAGVPGTGKTMLCSALAKWAIEQGYLVVYISSADPQGATFVKIEQALSIAASSRYPTLILLEELDAYLSRQEKALVLNVLDGAESALNEHGTLLISTTNYPEAIDERVLKRPGRLDRIFIIPEVKLNEDAERMLRLYLGDFWQDDHTLLVPQLVGYPGAFIREVAIYAMTQAAFEDLPHVPLAALEQSFIALKEQIAARDDLFTKRLPANEN